MPETILGRRRMFMFSREGGKLNFSPLNWEHREVEAEAVIRYNGTKQLQRERALLTG